MAATIAPVPDTVQQQLRASLALVAASKPAPKPRNLALYDLEEHLQCLLDSEETVPPELEAEYDLALREAVIATVAKRDRVGQFMAYLESQTALAAAEIKRLQDRKALFERTSARMEGHVTRVIESLGMEAGKDGKERYKKLEGNTVTLSLRGCDKRVEVTNEDAVPTKYKRVTVTLPAATWELVCDSLDLDLRDQVLDEVKSPKVEVQSSLVKPDLKAGIPVPGAELAGGFYLVRK
jgi:hypothetical protein